MSSSPTVYLVTGANQGIGIAVVAHILEKHSDAFVYAGVRDPKNTTSLHELARKYPGRTAIVQCVSGYVSGNKKVAEEIKNRHGHVDIVIANAAIAKVEHPVLETPITSYKEHFTVNVIGTIVLLQTMQDLLKKSKAPKFIPISTATSSIGSPAMSLPLRSAAYGSSKAALNYISRKAHFENEWLTIFSLAPGTVETDALAANRVMDKEGVYDKVHEQFGSKTPQQAAVQLLNIIDEATRDTSGGRFVNFDGTDLLW